MISFHHSTIFLDENKIKKDYYKSIRIARRDQFENLVKEKMGEDHFILSKIKISRNYTISGTRLKKENSFKDNLSVNEQEIRLKKLSRDMQPIRKYSSYSDNKELEEDRNLGGGILNDKMRFQMSLYNSFNNKSSVDKEILFSVKIKELMTKIILERKAAIEVIIKKMRSYLKILNYKKKILIEELIKSRNLKITLIQKNFRSYLVNKHVNEIRKNYDYVFFYDYIENREKLEKTYIDKQCKNIDNNLISNNCYNRSNKIKEIKIKFNKGKDGIGEYTLKYSKYMKIYYLPFKKQGVMRKRFKVNFIVDGNTIIDPKYEVDNDKTGHFYNVIESSMFKRRIPNSQNLLKRHPITPSSAGNTTKFWENIFEIKMNNSKEASSVSDISEHNDATIERLMNNMANIKSLGNISRNEKLILKPILKKTFDSDKTVPSITTNLNTTVSEPSPRNKRVTFSENVQFSY